MKEHFEPTSTINEKVKILDINDKKATFQHITQTSKASHVLSVGDSLSILSPELTGLTITGITKDLVILSNGMEKHKKTSLMWTYTHRPIRKACSALPYNVILKQNVTISIEKRQN